MSESAGAVIVGATSEIGREIARLLAEVDGAIVIAGRDQEELACLANDLQLRTGALVTAICVDVSAFDSHPAFVEQCIAALGHVKGVVLCQGYLADQRRAMEDWTETRQMIEVNFASVASLANRFSEHFVPRKRGYICAISSVAGDRGRQSNYLYGATKAGASAYLQGLRNRLHRSGVAVITVKPGFVDTSMTWGRVNPASPLVATPDRVASDVARAIRRRRNVVYSPWFWRWIMLVIRLMPEAIFKRLRL
jgi:short-subunit dehydrogenase